MNGGMHIIAMSVLFCWCPHDTVYTYSDKECHFPVLITGGVLLTAWQCDVTAESCTACCWWRTEGKTWKSK